MNLTEKHKKYLLHQPKYTIFEKIAGELAGVFYDAGRAAGMPSEFKSAKAFARAKFTTFLPKAIELCLSMLHDNPNVNQTMKDEIYNAYLERANDPYLKEIDQHDMNMKAIEKLLPKGKIEDDIAIKFGSSYHRKIN